MEGEETAKESEKTSYNPFKGLKDQMKSKYEKLKPYIGKATQKLDEKLAEGSDKLAHTVDTLAGEVQGTIDGMKEKYGDKKITLDEVTQGAKETAKKVGEEGKQLYDGKVKPYFKGLKDKLKRKYEEATKGKEGQ